MRTYLIAGILVTVCGLAYFRFSQSVETPKSSFVKLEKIPEPIETKAVSSKTVETETINEVKNPQPETIIEQPVPVAPAQTYSAVTAREPSASEIAREALYTVGLDPVAEKVWLDTINNPDTPAKDRKNLIEDLDTTGFKSHRNPTSDDVALIQSRLALIEKYAPSAMDPVNAAAFQEAKKDLTKMLLKATTPIQ